MDGDSRARLSNLVTSALAAIERPRVAQTDYDVAVRNAEDTEARRLRAERLDKLRVPLTAEMRSAIVASSTLKPHPKSPGISLLAIQDWLFCRAKPPCLIVVGGTGRGKSVGAAWAAANHDDTTVWISAPELIRVFASLFSAEDRLIQKRVFNARLTIIDDVGTELDAIRMRAALVELLEHRKDPDLKTLMTANITDNALRARYDDERLHSRLKESATFVADKGPDLRGTK